MKSISQISLVTLLTSCILGTVQAASQPNILFIFADDMSYETIGAFGILDIDTPHLDTLVERGATFDRFA